MAAKVFVKSGDTVQVISGDDKGVKGKVQKVFPETGRVIVEKVNMVKKHQKPRGQGMPGGIIEQEAAIDASNVMVVCPSAASPPGWVTSISMAKARPPVGRCACARNAAPPSTTDGKGGKPLWQD